MERAEKNDLNSNLIGHKEEKNQLVEKLGIAEEKLKKYNEAVS